MPRNRRRPIPLFVLLGGILSLSGLMTGRVRAWQLPAVTPVGPLGNNQYLAPTNQILNPVGTRISLPLQRLNDIAVNPKGSLVAVLSQRAATFYTVQGAFVAQTPLPDAASMKGIAFSPDGKLLAVSGTGSCGVVIIDAARFTVRNCLPLAPGSLPAGLVFEPSGAFLFVALNRANLVGKIDLAQASVVSTAPVGVAPLGVALTPDGKRLFVTNSGGHRTDDPLGSANSSGTRTLVDADGVASAGSVSVVDTSAFQTVAEIPAGLHPGGIAVSPDGSQVAVANANSDSVSIVDGRSLVVLAAVPVPAFPAGSVGSSPTDLAFSSDGWRLYVTLGGANALAAFDVAGGKYALRGSAGTDWFPVAVATAKDAAGDDVLFVANSKGTGRAGSAPLSVRNTTGTVNVIAGNAIGNATSAAVEAANNPFSGPAASVAVPDDLGKLGVRHVFLIIKENRTYDQVLGDIPAGNGSSGLAIYGERVTPNLHRLAQGFVLLDNYYASGTVSADGHQWITQGLATDYAERQQSAGWPRSYPYSGEDPLIFASSGFVWGNAIRHGLTVRMFGEFALPSGDYPGTWKDYVRASVPGTPTLPTPSVSAIASMGPILSPDYPAFSLKVSDTYRARLVLDQIRAWDAAGEAPNLVIIQLPCDHTMGTTPEAPSPQAMVADNDLAVGRIVEAISHSSFWRTSAIFATEDDAQDGVDHVDGHRTTCYLASPFARRGSVDSTNYNHTSLLRTVEELLGLPPMNRFDATATPMRASFTLAPDTSPFNAVMGLVPLEQSNPPLSGLRGRRRRAAKASQSMNFKTPDAAPENKLNRILWQAAKGWGARYPKPPHKKSCPRDPDD